MYGNEKRARLLAESAAFIALIAVGGWISIPILIIPFTLQNIFILLAAAVMKRYAVIPVGLYVLFGSLGLPIFHNGTAGLGVLLGPTGGFLIGFVIMSAVAGWLFEKETIRYDILACAAFVTGLYVFGTAWFMISTGAELTAALLACAVPYMPGDIIKCVIVEAVILRLRSAKNKTSQTNNDIHS